MGYFDFTSTAEKILSENLCHAVYTYCTFYAGLFIEL